jgi:hypothetical protein
VGGEHLVRGGGVLDGAVEDEDGGGPVDKAAGDGVGRGLDGRELLGVARGRLDGDDVGVKDGAEALADRLDRPDAEAVEAGGVAGGAGHPLRRHEGDEEEEAGRVPRLGQVLVEAAEAGLRGLGQGLREGLLAVHLPEEAARKGLLGHGHVGEVAEDGAEDGLVGEARLLRLEDVRLQDGGGREVGEEREAVRGREGVRRADPAGRRRGKGPRGGGVEVADDVALVGVGERALAHLLRVALEDVAVPVPDLARVERADLAPRVDALLPVEAVLVEEGHRVGVLEEDVLLLLLDVGLGLAHLANGAREEVADAQDGLGVQVADDGDGLVRRRCLEGVHAEVHEGVGEGARGLAAVGGGGRGQGGGAPRPRPSSCAPSRGPLGPVGPVDEGDLLGKLAQVPQPRLVDLALEDLLNQRLGHGDLGEEGLDLRADVLAVLHPHRQREGLLLQRPDLVRDAPKVRLEALQQPLHLRQHALARHDLVEEGRDVVALLDVCGRGGKGGRGGER